MDRRDFLTKGLPGVGVAVAGTGVALGQDDELKKRLKALGYAGGDKKPKEPKKRNFKLKYAPHFGMFRNHAGNDFVDELEFMASVGFTALEDNGMKGRSVEDQTRIAKAMERLGMTMGVFVAYANFGSSDFGSGNKEKRDAILKQIRESVEVAKRVNAKWVTVVPGTVNHRMDYGYQFANVVETLRYACDICAPTGLTMVLEPLNFRDHPELFLTRIPQGFAICRAVNSPCCKILDDLYHQQISEGNLIPNIDHAYSEIAYFQLGDNPGRREPTTGEINYLNVFKHIHAKGYTGIVGMEHGKSKGGKEGELALIEAYTSCDSF